MAITSTKVMGSRDLHPFFDPSKRQDHVDSAGQSDSASGAAEVAELANGANKGHLSEHQPSKKKRTKRKRKSGPNATKLSSIWRSPEIPPSEAQATAELDPDLNTARRKRSKQSHDSDEERKTSSTEEITVRVLDNEELTHGDEKALKALNAGPVERASYSLPSTPKKAPVISDEASTSNDIMRSTTNGNNSNEDEAPNAGNPLKALRLNRQGTLITPPKKRRKANEHDKTGEDESSATPRKRRKKRRIVVMQYGIGDPAKRSSLGFEIQKILDGGVSRSANADPVKTQALNPLKPTHPFFSGTLDPQTNKSMRSNNEEEGNNRKTSPGPNPMDLRSATTPGKLKYLRQGARSADSSQAVARPTFGMQTKPRLMGTFEPTWPWKTDRGVDDEVLPARNKPRLDMQTRRQKNKTMEISSDDSIILRFGRKLSLNNEYGLDSIGATDLIHLPERHVTTGEAIQRLIKQELTSPESWKQHRAHHIAYGKIAKTRSAFDMGACESTLWCKKYAPIAALEVLQMGEEVRVLRDWLSSLTTSVVDTGLAAVGKQDTMRNARKKVKKKRKTQELGDFIVSDEEDAGEMQDMVDENDDSTLSTSLLRNYDQALSTTSIVKSMNAVLLSGPHGCGKTAAAYAVAEELDFAVFEINSSTRRSGKDVLDQVGNMTRNHLVRKHQSQVLPPLDHDECAENKLPSPQKPTLTSFFGVSGTKASAKSSRGRAKKPATEDNDTSHSKQQKQSLILLEEVDVLFEEDRQFWETVLELAVRSKRPIIMTCNEEKLVPLEELSLHAILRLRAPDSDIASDYISLVAAAEGHLLNRDAVSSLYKANQCDLRATLTHLNFWCQMSVGDDKGGLSWYLKRWPPGSDVDLDGRKLRVLSSGTFHSGLLPQEVTSDRDSSRETKTSNTLTRHAPDSPMSTQRLTKDAESSDDSEQQPVDHKEARRNLETLSHTFDSLSAVDVFARADTLPSSISDLSTPQHLFHGALDPTQPPMPVARRQDYIDGYPLLQTDLAQDYEMFDSSIASYVHHQTEKQVSDIMKPCDYPHCAAYNDKPSSLKISQLHSVLSPVLCSVDSTIPHLAIDIAPYARAICSHDLALEEQRSILSSSQDGRQSKRLRKTRAARSALEGGQRSNTRRERWFPKTLNYEQVMKSGGQNWSSVMYMHRNEEVGSDIVGSQGSNDELAY
ncbi:MAG: hypothetical protein M1828_005271 [Chrysothrix sp. TS-e1954]|nr:MAG: hypothetical protein M1828_005271 [Chrysothrix sp. TS-e1954]